MGLFGALARTVIHVASLPVEIVKDVATMGGNSTGEDEPYTVSKLKKIGRDVEDIGDEIDDL